MLTWPSCTSCVAHREWAHVKFWQSLFSTENSLRKFFFIFSFKVGFSGQIFVFWWLKLPFCRSYGLFGRSPGRLGDFSPTFLTKIFRNFFFEPNRSFLPPDGQKILKKWNGHNLAPLASNHHMLHQKKENQILYTTIPKSWKSIHSFKSYDHQSFARSSRIFTICAFIWLYIMLLKQQ